MNKKNDREMNRPYMIMIIWGVHQHDPCNDHMIIAMII